MKFLKASNCSFSAVISMHLIHEEEREKSRVFLDLACASAVLGI